MARCIGIGLVGASTSGGWAAYAHVPAIAALPDVALAAVCTTNEKSAKAAAREFGAQHAFADYETLVQCPDVDLVAVTVKVPYHREIVAAAIAAGKDVYCEWPLVLNEAEADELRQQAVNSEVRTVIGLQSRMEPAINTVRDLIAAGDIGEILSTTMIGTVNPGASIDSRNAYCADRTTGANAFTISCGHSMDAMCYTLGEFEQIRALLDTRVRTLTISGSEIQIQKTAPDQIAVLGTLDGGAVASVHIREALCGYSEFLWEINGSKGTFRLSAPHAHPGFYPLSVTRSDGDGSQEIKMPIDRAYGAPLLSRPAITSLGTSPAANVARLYARYADDVRSGQTTAPDFGVAVTRHRMIAAIEAASVSG